MENMNVADIIQQAFAGRPQGVEDAFNSVIQQKMADAIETRRQEIAHNMFADSEGDEPNSEVEADVESEVDTYETDQVEVEEPTDEDV